MRFLTLLILLFLRLPASAEPPGSLSGRITDTAGLPLPGAIIELPELHTGDVSDSAGYFHISNLPSGRFLVSVRLLGFATQDRYMILRGATVLNIRLSEAPIAQHEVVVTGTSIAAGLRRSAAPVQSLSAAQMREHASTNIIDAISRVPGVRQVSTGPAISKPVIRGLGYNRVVTLADGIRQEGQQWGDEHGIELDDYNVGRIEIVKGPASLAYGSDAVAGVINILSEPPPPEGRITGRLAANYQTNNGQAALHARLAGNEHGLSWSAYYTGKRAHDYRNSADGYVFDTRYGNDDYGASLGIRRPWGSSRLSFTSFNQRLGLPEGERDSASGRFIRHVEQNGSEEIQPVTDAAEKSYQQTLPNQHIRHQRLAWNNDFFLRHDARLSITAGYQQNDRQEFSEVLQPDKPGLWLRLRSITAELQYRRPLAHNWELSAGLSGMDQQNENLGEEFIVPDYELRDFGGFLILRREHERWTLSGGLRIDHRGIRGQALYEDSAGRRANQETAGGFKRFAPFSLGYLAPSGSVGASYAAGKNTVLRASLASGFRTPNIAELAANGVHEGALRYEYGSTSLHPEQSFEANLGGNWHSNHLSLSADVFANYISHYIFFRTLLAQNGSDSVPARNNPDGFPAFIFTQTDALLWGGEAYADLHPHPWDWLHVEQTFSFVQGQNLHGSDSTRYLPQMPAPRWLIGLRAQRKSFGKHIANAYIRLEAGHYFAQQKVFSAYGSETPSPAYTLLNAGLGFDLQAAGKTRASVTLAVQNIADIAYQDHLSRLRYADMNYATGQRGIFGMGRNVSVSVSVPLEFH